MPAGVAVTTKRRFTDDPNYIPGRNDVALIVQKYGGTSVADTERILAVAGRVVATAKQGNQVIVVVSAMAGETDKLIRFAHEITDIPDEREMDMLLSSGERITSALTAIAIQKLGCRSISFTGRQVGIITDSSHTKAMRTHRSGQAQEGPYRREDAGGRRFSGHQ